MPTTESITPKTEPDFMAAVTVVFNDGVYAVTRSKHFVSINKHGGPSFNVSNGHAWFERVAEADCRRVVEDLHTELVQTIAS